MEKRKRPSIFDLVEWYMERALDEMGKLPAPTEEELSRMLRRGPQDFDEWLHDPFEEMRRKLEEEMPEDAKRYGPFIYGFSYTKEPGKDPELKEFGNIKHSHMRLEPSPGGEREPLIDVIDQNDAYEVVAELPGVEKEDLRLHTTEDSLEIKTENGRRFFKEVLFETLIKPETAKATYKNGVLSVRLKKKENEKKRTAIPLE
ncbi:MAG TPA: archaeal heat shock protein Hsp20 [Candidatus Bathyarchaeia archaeon]|nr:archaeal heat shock protein Hsp20 [Candidatus Bathyarchaeia archaeon]